MKKFFLLTSFLQTFFIILAETTPQPPTKPVEIPIVIQGPEQPLVKDRSLDIVTILCSFEQDVFTFEFLQSIGNVSITIINLTSNFVETQECVDSNVGCFEYAVSGEHALYSIIIVDENGTIYYGEFYNNLTN